MAMHYLFHQSCWRARTLLALSLIFASVSCGVAAGNGMGYPCKTTEAKTSQKFSLQDLEDDDLLNDCQRVLLACYDDCCTHLQDQWLPDYLEKVKKDDAEGKKSWSRLKQLFIIFGTNKMQVSTIFRLPKSALPRWWFVSSCNSQESGS